jgi:hypothetical protein
MEKNLKGVLNLFMLLSAVVLAAQCAILLTVAGPITLTGLGTISKEMISYFFAQIMLICAVLILLAILSFRPNQDPDPCKKMSPLLILLVAGSLCCIEGIASINLATGIVAGINKSFMITFGIQLFCLGIISIAAFVAAKGHSCLIKHVPNYYALIFFILLVPAAFLIGN